jgi:formate dehydrogenase (coenzyme F420) beta subunit
MAAIADKIAETAHKLFAEGKVDLVIGWEKGTLPLRARPAFVTSAEGAGELTWSPFCGANLAAYLPQYFQVDPRVRNVPEPPRIAIVAKGCEIRSIVGLVREKQVPREKLTIIGVPCSGMIDPGKVEELLGGDEAVSAEETADGNLSVKTASGETRTLERAQVVGDCCLECENTSADGADVQIDGQGRKPSRRKYDGLRKLEGMSTEQRWEYFTSEISSCIRCYACRQACPNCYCKVCFTDRTKPEWLGAGNDESDLLVFQIGRIFHQAGRCVDCGACVRACPMNIDLRAFTLKPVKDVQALFGYYPGLNPEEQAPLCTFKPEDSNQFVSDPKESSNG